MTGVRPPEDIRTRLRRALADALKARDADTVTALRSAMSAIVRREAAEREAAAGEYERAGHAAEAARLRQGTRALMATLEEGA